MGKDIREKEVLKYVKLMQKSIERLEYNKDFKVKELIKEYWPNLSDGLMRSIGKRFKAMVDCDEIKNIELVEKPNNGNVYRKDYERNENGYIIIRKRKI